MAEHWEKELAKALWNAKSPQDVQAIIDECKRRYNVQEIAISRENNSGTIDVAADPGMALVERITNGIDANIDLQARLSADADLPSSPEAAVTKYFGIPDEGLVGLTDTERRALAQRLVVGMHDSGDPGRPTIRVTDQGSGQHPSFFAKTLLSLNESNKRGAKHLAGDFGQGGSATLSFSGSTVYVSRLHPELLGAEMADRVGFTVAFKQEVDHNEKMYPAYVWLVDENEEPLTLPADAFPELEHGTRITHVSYELTKSMAAAFTTQMWQFLNRAMFDPVLPFLLEGDRSETERKAKDRVITGSATRLKGLARAKGDLTLDYSHDHTIVLEDGQGSVRLSYFVLGRPEGATGKDDTAAASYRDANNAVLMLLHGKQQASMSHGWLNRETQLPFLKKKMVVVLDANGVSFPARAKIFTSTRERARLGPLAAWIFEEAVSIMRNDPSLKQLNNDARERKMQESSLAASDNVQKRIGKYVKTKKANSKKAGKQRDGGGSSSGTGGPGFDPGTNRGKDRGRSGRSPVRSTDDSHLNNVPTTLAFGSKKLTISQGFTSTVLVEIDAKNRYLPRHSDDLDIKFSGEAANRVYVKSSSDLLGGASTWRIECPVDVPVGDYQMDVSLVTAGGVISGSLPVAIQKAPVPSRGGKGGRDDETGPDVRWVKDDEFGTEFGGVIFTPDVVGAVSVDQEATIIFVNQHFRILERAVRSNRNLSQEQIATRRDTYLYPVACGLWLQQHEISQISNEEDEPSEEYQAKEMHRLAEAVIQAANIEVELAGVADD